jgi:hypothetical protein
MSKKSTKRMMIREKEHREIVKKGQQKRRVRRVQKRKNGSALTKHMEDRKLGVSVL